MVTIIQRAMRPAAKVEPPTPGLKVFTAVVTLLALCATLPVRAYKSPLDTIPGFWSFAARNEAITMIVFPAWWPTLGPPTNGLTFEVQKSRHSAFDHFETVPFDPQNSIGDVKFAIDPWNGTLLHYRVQVAEVASSDRSLDPPAIIDTSPPTRAIDQANTVFVSPSLGQDSLNCGVLQNGPCKTMQAAIDVAKSAGAMVVAATPGEYSGPGNVDLDLSGTTLKITSTNGPTHTLINCTDPSGAQHRAFLFKSGEDKRTELSGFTLFGGEADRGGCVYVENSSPTISNVAMVMCKAMTGISRGGALYVTGPGANPTITDSMFFYNQADKGGTIEVMESQMKLENSKLELGVCPTGTGEGGGIHAMRSNVTVHDSSFVNGIAGFAGAGILLHDSIAMLERIEVRNNTVANTGAGINLYGSSMTLVDSLITENTSNLFGGGLLFTSSNATIFNTAVINNYAGFGGGAVKLLGGYLNLTSCQISGNVGVEYGAAFDVMTQGPLSVQKTVMVVDRCEISDNMAGDGAAFYLYDIDELAVSNSMVRNNSARAGGAVWSRAPGATSFDNVFFHENFAVDGGAIFCTEPCELDIASSEFARNGASSMGGAIFSTEGTKIDVVGSSFVENGAQSCEHRQTPLRGGAVSVGVEVVDGFSDSCTPINGTKTTVLSISDALFSSNLAQLAGGAIFAESGQLNVQRTAFEDNRAGLPSVRDGLGGALSLKERCVNGACTMLQALVYDADIQGNVAQLAGGGIHVSGSNPESQTTIVNAKFVANQASSGFTMGIGGGLYFDNPRVNVTYAQFSNNTAKMLGGAVYVSSDGSEGVSLDNLFMADNRADNGRDVFWEKLKFAEDEYLTSNSIIFAIEDDAKEGGDRSVIATESIEVVFDGTAVPDVTQSGTAFAPILLNIIDFYGQLAITEEGECRALVSDNSASVRALGSVVAIRSGRAVFSELQITGKIGSIIRLDITCTTNVEYLSGLVSPRILPVVGFDVELSGCPPGSSPVVTGEGDVCVACPFGTFNDDGEECVTCPRGALCPGGSDLLSEANWWRSSAASMQFYQCLYPDVCLPGDHAGNDACANGHEGPLCGVCKDGWFEFGGKCRECNGRNATSKIFIAFSAVIIAAVLALLFARSWDFGDPASPGILSKVKIVLVHFQIISLLKRYDVKWPPASEEGFSWLSVIDFGPGMLAPECWIGKKYTFWTSWILNVAALPVLIIVLCMGIHRVAVVAHQARMRRHPEGSKLSTWLVALQLRCYKNAYWLLTLVYPGACLVALQMFARERLDIGTYLSSDLSLKVTNEDGGYTSTYVGYMVPGGILLALLAVGVPAFCFYTIWRNRWRLDEPATGKAYGFLYGSYSRSMPYCSLLVLSVVQLIRAPCITAYVLRPIASAGETVQMMRRFVFALIPVFVNSNAEGSLQASIAQAVAIGLLLATAIAMPYAKRSDNAMEIMSHVIINILILSGSTVTWASVSSGGLRAIAALQLVLSSAVVFVAAISVLYGVVMFFRKRGAKWNAKVPHADGLDGGIVHVHVTAATGPEGGS